MGAERLKNMRIAAELGKGMTLKDIREASDRQILGLYQQMSEAVLVLVDEVERLQGGVEVGGLKVGDKVELLACLMHHRVGDIGTVDQIDTEDSHQYPYHYPYLIRVGTTVRIRYARHELKKVE